MGGFSLRDGFNQLFPPPPIFTEKDVPPQQGRVFIVTGGNSGVGYELCRILYATGATVYMASRSKDRAESAIRAITSPSTPVPSPGKLLFLPLDLNDLQSVKAAATMFAKKETKLDVLWNNAGCGPYRLEHGSRTAQGLEPMVGMHCVAAQLFSELLLPQLRGAAAHYTTTAQRHSSRVVWTSSISADGSSPANGIDFDALENTNNDLVTNYAVSKFGNWMLGREYGRRHGNGGIISVTVNPGNIKAGSYDGMPAVAGFIVKRLLHETKYGAYTQLYAGLSPDITPEHNGAYILPWGRIRPLEEWSRKDLVQAATSESEGGLGYDKRFWDWCEMQWKGFGY